MCMIVNTQQPLECDVRIYFHTRIYICRNQSILIGENILRYITVVIHGKRFNVTLNVF